MLLVVLGGLGLVRGTTVVLEGGSDGAAAMFKVAIIGGGHDNHDWGDMVVVIG